MACVTAFAPGTVTDGLTAAALVRLRDHDDVFARFDRLTGDPMTAGTVRAACLASALRDVRERGWTHHVPRLMVLGNHALQRGLDPAAVTEWFRETFVDGYDWVMLPNVVGMSQWADGGAMATKPYASGGAYIDRMSDHCGRCPYDPKVRVGEDACPFTAGYWAFLERNRDRFRGNHRMAQPLAGLTRLKDLEAVVAQGTAHIGVIATPAEAAQDVCDRLVAAGIRSILNFAPVVLTVPAGVAVVASMVIVKTRLVPSVAGFADEAIESRVGAGTTVSASGAETEPA